MTTPQDPGSQPDPSGSAWSLQKQPQPTPAADQAAGQGQWYQDPSGQWWYQDPSGQWYQDPRYADPAAAAQQPAQPAAHYPPPANPYPQAEQTQTQWGGYSQPTTDPSGYGQAYGQQQYPGYGSSPYPGYSGYGSPYGTPQKDVHKRPGIVVASAVLWIVSGVLALATSLIFTIYAASASDQTLYDDLDLSIDDLDNIDEIRTGLVVAGVLFAAFAVGVLVFGSLLLKRKSWARGVVIPFGVISLVPLLFTLFVGWIMVIVAIVLQFLPAANDWFRARRGSPYP